MKSSRRSGTGKRKAARNKAGSVRSGKRRPPPMYRSRNGQPGRKGSLPGLSMKDTARELGITPGYLRMLVVGERTPSLALAERMSDKLGWTLEEITKLGKGKIPEVRIEQQKQAG